MLISLSRRALRTPLATLILLYIAAKTSLKLRRLYAMLSLIDAARIPRKSYNYSTIYLSKTSFFTTIYKALRVLLNARRSS